MLLTLVLASAANADDKTPLQKAAAQLAPGEWAKLETKGFTRELLRVKGHHIFQYTHDGQWDPKSRQFLFVGQGHYSPLKFIAFDERENAWTLQPTPPWWKVDPEKGRGPIGHAYDNNAIDVAGRVLYHQQYNSPRVHRYHIDEDRWGESLEVDGQKFIKGGHSSGLVFFPEMGGLVRIHRVGHVDLYDPKAGQWKAIHREPLPMGKLHPFVEYSPTHNCVIFGGGNESNDVHRLNADGSIRQIASPPFEGLDSTHRYVITVDPVGGEFLVINNVREGEHQGSMFALDVSQGDGQGGWRLVAGRVPCSGSMIAAPLAGHGVIMVCSYRPEEVWLYRHKSR